MKCTICPTPRDTAISCATDKELITKIGTENYTSYYRHMAACELARRLRLELPLELRLNLTREFVEGIGDTWEKYRYDR